MTELTGVLILATVVEAVVEYFVAPPLKRYAAPPYIVKYVAAGVGILLCVTYNVDILNMLASLVPIHPMLGYILSGIIIGRGGNIINDIVGLVRGNGGHDSLDRYRKYPMGSATQSSK